MEGARAGSVVIDHSTIHPDGTRQIAFALRARNIEMLDAPVSGGPAVAEDGALSIMVGGDEAAEALLMAERAGVDPTKVKDVLMTGFGASRMLDLQGPKMIARDFDGRIESRLHYKDIHIVLAMARALGIELPASLAAAHVLSLLQNRGGGKKDTAAMFTVIANP